jgi:hypothetical protein
MIAKGNTHDNGPRLARYLTTGKPEEYAELWELRGFASRDITEALRTVQLIAKGGQCTRPFFHVQIRNRAGETLSQFQWKNVADRIERILGLRDQPRAIAVHVDRRTGHEHIHIAFSRIDQETLKAKPLPFYKLRLKRVSRALEIELGLTAVKNERDGPVKYAPTRGEDEQARRLGVDIHDVRGTIRNCFEQSDSGQGFQSALADAGMILARGDRRDFLVVDRAGGMHALGKRVLGVSAAEIRYRLADLRGDHLPSIDEARRSILRQQEIKDCSKQGLGLAVTELAPQPRGRCRARNLDDEFSESQDRFLTTPSENEQTVKPGHTPAAPPEQVIPVSAPVGTVAAVPVLTDNPNSDAVPRRLSTFLKSQFRAVVKALTNRTESPQPQTRRRRSGETAGTFKLAATAILRPISRLPFVAPATAFLRDTLIWLHLWEWNENVDKHEISGDPGGSDKNHLSPRL